MVVIKCWWHLRGPNKYCKDQSVTNSLASLVRGITTKANLEYLGLNLVEGRSYNGTVTEALTSQRSKIDHAEVDFSVMLRTLVEKIGMV